MRRLLKSIAENIPYCIGRQLTVFLFHIGSGMGLTIRLP